MAALPTSSSSDLIRPAPAAPGRVSLVMATFQRTHCIGETVRQLLDTQTRPPFEIIVVNNDPAPGAEAAVRAALPADPRVRVTSCTTGRQGAARNHGLTLVIGDYVAFVDDDDDYAPTYIAALAGALDLGLNSVRCRIQTCGCAGPDCTGRPTIAHHPLPHGTMTRRERLTPTWTEPPNEDREYWARHPVEGAIDDCLVVICRGPGQHSPRNAARGGSWRERFVITVLVTRETAKQLPSFLSALKEQSYGHFVCVVHDMAGDDKTRRSLDRLAADDARFLVHRADGMMSRDALVRLLSNGVVDVQHDDIVLALRANERLAHRGVLNRLAHVYGEQPDVWATYGACSTEPFAPDWPQASFSPPVWEARSFRTVPMVIGEYAPLTMRATLARTLQRQLSADDVALAAGGSVEQDDSELALFLCTLEAAGRAHTYAMAECQVIKHIDTASYKQTPLRQASISRQFEVRARPAIATIDALAAEQAALAAAEVRNAVDDAMPATAPVTTVAARPIVETDAVVWMGPVYDPSGYGTEVRELVLNLDRAGTQVVLCAAANASERYKASFNPSQRDRLDMMLAEPDVAPFLGVLHLPPAFLQRLGGARYMIARTMFETDGLPPAMVERCNRMDELWVPSAFNERTFRAAGVKTRFLRVPGGIDSTRFTPGLDPYPIPGARGTVFLSAIEWKARKGWHTLLTAWANAFSAHDDVTLVFRANIPGHTDADSGPAIEQQIDAFLSAMGRSRRDVAPIVVMGRPVRDADIPRLYAAANAYVTTSSGEGWGYPYMEAMASGLPTIATRWSGNLEFMNDANSLLCDIEGLIPAIDEYVGEMPNQRWAQPSAAHLATLLRVVVDDPARAATLAAQGLHDMRTTWTWENAAAIVQSRLIELSSPRKKRRAAGTPVVPSHSEPAPSAAAVTVRWEGPYFTFSSLGVVNRELTAELLAMPDVALLPRPTFRHDFVPESTSRYGALLERMRSTPATRSDMRADVHVAHQYPPVFHAPAEGAWVMMQPWEYGGLPGEWVPVLRDQVDEYWVYCQWQRDCAVASGVPAEKVAVIPLGVDTTRYRPDGARYALKTRKRTKLLAVGGIIPRKGMDLLVQTYLRTFTAADDVCLVIKGLSARWAYQGNAGQTDFAALPALAKASGAAEIEFIGDTLDDDAVASLYRACDVFVAPFRGEGFGLPIAEAMASAMPVVVTHFGPVLDLCDEQTAYLIPATEVPVPPAIAGVDAGRVPFTWAEPDLEALSRLLKHAVGHRDEGRAMGARARARILERFTYAHSARAAADRARVLATRTPARFTAAPAYGPAGATYPLDAPRSVVLLHQPQWHHAEWPDAIRAYLRTFTTDDDVSLVLTLDPAQGLSGEQVAERMATLRGELGHTDSSSPDVLLVPDELTDDVLASLYRAADHVIVGARDATARTRAAAVGVPVIADLGSTTLRAAIRPKV